MPPQRLSARMFSHRLILNACTSAFAGAGPVYVFAELLGGVACWLTVVDAPPPLQAARVASTRSVAQGLSARAARVMSPSDTGRVATAWRFIAALPYWPGQAAADSWNTCLSL